MFVQWLQAYDIDRQTMHTVLATFKSVFPQVEVWQSKPGDLVLVGSEQRPAYSVPALRSKLQAEPFASALPCAWHTAGLEGCFRITSAARHWSTFYRRKLRRSQHRRP